MIDRIVKLLAKAEATTPHEAEALMAKAEELMIRHSIELLDIERAQGKSQTKPEQIITHKIVFEGKSYAKVRMSNALGIAKALGLQGYYIAARDMRTYTAFIVGYERDVRDAELLINSLDMQGATAMKEWWAVERAEYSYESYRAQRMERRTFLLGFGSVASQRIRARRKQVASEYVGTGTDVAIIDRERQVRVHLESTVRLGRGRGNDVTGSSSSRDAGARAGASANIGGTGVGGSRSALGQ